MASETGQVGNVTARVIYSERRVKSELRRRDGYSAGLWDRRKQFTLGEMPPGEACKQCAAGPDVCLSMHPQQPFVVLGSPFVFFFFFLSSPSILLESRRLKRFSSLLAVFGKMRL